MQFIDLNKQYQALKEEIDSAIHSVLDKSNYIMGDEVRTLEKSLAEYVGVKHCITCANGTDALSLALMAYDIKAGDAVFLPTFTFYATAEVVSLSGATPIFVDIEKDSFNISVNDLNSRIEKVKAEGKLNARAVIAVDLFGLPADFRQVDKLCEKHNLLLIEDGAQGFGGSIDGKPACSFGDIAATSFFPAKPLGCYGDGGAVFTNEDKVKETLESFKVHGKGSDKYDNVRVGLNSRLDTIQAAVLSVKLNAFDSHELHSRNKIASKYSELLSKYVNTPFIPHGYISSYAQYSILLKDETQRDSLQEHLKSKDIPTMIYYKKSMHEQTVYRNNISSHWGYPVADDISRRILSLPMHPYMSEVDVEIVCEAISKWF